MTVSALAPLIALAVGVVVGSILNSVADRVPRHRPVLAAPSRCAACGRRQSSVEIIPILGYLWLRGHCRACGAAIGRRVLIVEVAAGLIAVGAWWLYGPTLATIIAAIYGWLFLLLSVMDLEYRRVYGIVLGPSLILAVVASPWWPPAGFPGALIGAVVAWAPYALLYVIAGCFYGRGKGLGLGDVKVAALMGLVAGFPGALVALYAAILSGGAVAVVLLLAGWKRRGEALPTVPFFALGALASVLWRSGML